MHRINRVITLLAVVMIAISATAAHAQTQPITKIPLIPGRPSTCFLQEECDKYGGFAIAQPECAPFKPAEFICGAKPPRIKLSVPFGGNNEAFGLTSYIGIIYKFLIGAAGILAGIMITIAGFEWLTAAGDSGKIKHAKERITKALLGLVLALGAYTILYTINPALISLQLQPIKLIRPEDSFTVPYGKFCKVGRDDAACAAATPGAKCIKWEPVQPDCTLAKSLAISGIVIASAATGGTAAAEIAGVAGGAGASLQGIIKVGKYVYGKIGTTGVLVIAGGTYAYQKVDGWIADQGGANEQGDGMCLIPERDTNFKRPGEWCSTNAECQSNRCAGLGACSPIAGVCVDGGKNSPCWIGGDPPTTAQGLTCNSGLQCIRISTAGGVSSNNYGSCSDQSWGLRCEGNNTPCSDGESYCSSTYHVCIKKLEGVNEGEACRTDYDCIGNRAASSTTAKCLIQLGNGEMVYGSTVALSGDRASITGICTRRSEGSTCTTNTQGGSTSACTGGLICIPYGIPNSSQDANRCEQPGALEEACDINNSSSSCASGLICNAITTQTITRDDGKQVTVTGACRRRPGGACTENNDCYLDGPCQSGICQTPRCTSDAQCGSGFRCDTASGACLIR